MVDRLVIVQSQAHAHSCNMPITVQRKYAMDNIQAGSWRISHLLLQRCDVSILAFHLRLVAIAAVLEGIEGALKLEVGCCALHTGTSRECQTYGMITVV